MEKFPKMNCTFADGHVKLDCTTDDFCPVEGVTKNVTYEIDYTDSETLHNWVEKLDLFCEPKWKIGMMGSAFFIGWSASILILPRLSDVSGRKIFWRVGMTLQTLCFVLMFLTKSLNFMIIIFFSLGVLSSIRVGVGFAYFMEMLPQKWQTPAGSVFQMIEASVSIFTTVYYAFIMDKWIYTGGFAMTMQLTAFVCAFLVSESPRLLMK